MPAERITIVDEADHVIGSEERSIVRTKGLRHRIARIFIINAEGQILLHRRSEQLKDNPGKWDQSAGGHVDEGEDYLRAARRETEEELGVKAADFTAIGKFYIERDAPGGVVRRFQTVFTAKWDGPVIFDKTAIAEVRWFTPREIEAMYRRAPDAFTKNFAKAFALVHKV